LLAYQRLNNQPRVSEGFSLALSALYYRLAGLSLRAIDYSRQCFYRVSPEIYRVQPCFQEVLDHLGNSYTSPGGICPRLLTICNKVLIWPIRLRNDQPPSRALNNLAMVAG
jgi:hypothetical protein